MKTIFAVATLVLGTALWSTDAGAWASANRFGGRTQHSFGETSHSNAWGGSTEHVAGEGTEHTNMYGGNSAHAYGGGSEHTNMYGGSTYGAAGYGAVHTYPGGASYHAYGYGYGYGAYHPPVAVPYYGSSCYGCAAAAGAVVGLATGAAIASANTAAVASYVVQRRSRGGRGRGDVRDGCQLRDPADRLRYGSRQFDHVLRLREQQYVVQAVVRCEWGFLQGGGCALTRVRAERRIS